MKLPIDKIKVCDIGFRFEKYFINYGNFEGCVMEVRKGIKGNKSRRCRYHGGILGGGINVRQLTYLKGLTPLYISPIKKIQDLVR